MHAAVHHSIDAAQDSPLQVRPWLLMETAVPTASEIPIHEALFSIGNGFIGFRGYHERVESECVATPRGGGNGSALLNSSGLVNNNARSSVFETTITQNPVAGPVRSQRGCYINGVYDENLVEHVGSAFTSGTCKRECAIVPVPDLLSVEVSVNDERVAPCLNPDQVDHYHRALNLKTGELTRRFTWTSSGGVAVKVVERRLVCAARKNIVAAQYSYTVIPSSRNPSSVEAQVVSETVLPDGPASSCWEVESVTKTERVEDVVSVLSARTRRSRKHVTIATNERCAVGQLSGTTGDWTPLATSLPLATGATQHLGGGNASFAFAKADSGAAAGGTEGVTSPAVTSPHVGSTNAASTLHTVPQLMTFASSSSNYFTDPAVDRRTGPFFGASLGIPPPFTSADCSPMIHLRPSSPVLGTPFGTTTGNHHDSSAAASERSADDPAVGREPNESLLTVFRGLLHCTEPSAPTTMVFTKIAACFTDVDCDVEDMEAKASEQLEAALDLKYEGLLQEQQEFMTKFWATSDVVITANDDTQGTLRFNILQLFMSAGRWKWTAVGPRGLTGEVFNGLQSVDAELFVVPFFVHSNPPIAKSILQFRVDTLPEAQRRALEFELKRGAIYPPRTINGGDNAPSLTCALHLHVNADIVYAIKQYYEATLDIEFMLRGGIEVVWQTALVWLEWGAWEKGVFHLRNVTGPDEYNVLVDDNYYTNLMAQHHMRFAVEILDRLQAQFPQELERLMSAQCCAMEPGDFAAMREAAEKISLPYDPHHRIHLQDASFLQKRSWDKVLKKDAGGGNGSLSSPHMRGVRAAMPPSSQTSSGAHLSEFSAAATGGTYKPRVGDCMANHHRATTPSGDPVKTYANAAAATPPPYTTGTVGNPAVMIQEYHPVVVFRHRICKTADVVFASILLRDRFTRDEKEANFKFYEGLTAHDSSLSAPTFCIAASDVQLRETALRYFQLSLNIDVHNILKNTSGGLHMSCLGGSWLCIVSGFGGFHVLNGVAHFHPWMPDGWDEYRFAVRHQAAVIHVQVTRRQVTYALHEGSKLLVIHAQASRVHLARGRPVTIKLLRDVRSFDFDAVVFDLDSIVDSVEEDHFESWRRTLDPLFQQLEGPQYKPFNHEMYLAYLKHHPISLARRHQGLQKLLVKRGLDVPVGDPTDETPSAHSMYGLIARKLQHFRSVVKERGIKVREGALALLADLRENGVAIGVVSASKNGHWILQQSPKVRHMVDCFIDATVGEEHHLRWRPELDYFDWCTRKLDTTTGRTIAFIDGIDGFSKKSLQHYWMVVNTSVDDALPEASIGTAAAGEDGGAGVPEELQPLIVPDFSGLSTDVLHERGSFLSPLHRQQGTPPFKVGHAPDKNASFTSLAT